MKSFIELISIILSKIRIPFGYICFSITIVSGYLIFFDTKIIENIQLESFIEVATYTFIISTIICLIYVIQYIVSTIKYQFHRIILLRKLTPIQNNFLLETYKNAEFATVDLNNGPLKELVDKRIVAVASRQIVNQAFSKCEVPCYLPDWVKKHCKKLVKIEKY